MDSGPPRWVRSCLHKSLVLTQSLVPAAAHKSSSLASHPRSSEAVSELKSWNKREQRRNILTIYHIEGTKLRMNKRRRPSYRPEDQEAFYRLLGVCSEPVEGQVSSSPRIPGPRDCGQDPLGLGAERCPSGAAADHQAFMFWFCCGANGFSSETSSWREKRKRLMAMFNDQDSLGQIKGGILCPHLFHPVKVLEISDERIN